MKLFDEEAFDSKLPIVAPAKPPVKGIGHGVPEVGGPDGFEPTHVCTELAGPHYPPIHLLTLYCDIGVPDYGNWGRVGIEPSSPPSQADV